MIKTEFLAGLERRLSALPQEEIDRALQFYAEMIDDRKKEGLTEPEAVNSLGPMDEIAEEVVSGAASGTPLQDRRRRSNNHVLLLVLGSPLWFLSIVLGICAWFLLSLTLLMLVWSGWMIALLADIVIGALLLSAWITIVALAIGLTAGGVVSIVASPFLLTRGIAVALYTGGTGLVAAGIGALMLPLLRPATKGLWKAAMRSLAPAIRGMGWLSGKAWALCKYSLVGFKHRFIDREVR